MEWIELERLASIETGKLNANAANVDGRYPFFTCADEILRINDYKYDKECILIAGNGNLNVKYYVGKFNAYQRTYIVESKDKRNLNIMYLYYFMDTYMDKLRELSIGGVIKYIKLEHLEKAKIPVPSIETQEKIVEVLDQAKAIIDKRKEQIEFLDKLIESIFYTMFGDLARNEKGWKKGTLNDYYIVKTGKTPKRDKEEFWDNPEINWIKTGEIRNTIINASEEKISQMAQKELNMYKFEEGTILIAMYGQGNTRGRVGWLNIKATTNQACAGLVKRENSQLNNMYVYKYLSFSYEKLRSLARGGNQANLNLNIIKEFIISIPPISLQNEFAEKVEAIEKQKEMLNQSLELMEENYKSLMDKAFKGQLFK